MIDVITASNLTLGYKNNHVIKEANFTINAGDFVIITGESGSGKSTLLKSLYGDIAPYGGDLYVYSNHLNAISAKGLRYIRQRIGIVFQDFRLIDEWNIQKNVRLPLLIDGNLSKKACEEQAMRLLKHVKLSHKADRLPLELSGGEQQRVAMARAMSHNPKLFLCDEPTGNLDEYSSDLIWALLRSARESWGASVVVVTHKLPSMLRYKYRHFEIKNGKINEVN